MVRFLPLLLIATIALFGVGCSSTNGGLEDEAPPEKTVLFGPSDAAKYSAIVYFDAGSPTLREAGRHELMWFAEKMRRYPDAEIDVRGFSERAGADLAKPKLANERAQSVARFLESQGIALSRITQSGSIGATAAGDGVVVSGRTNHRRATATVR